jgi:hypothetical protein
MTADAIAMTHPRRHLKWPLIVVGLLVVHMSAMVVAVVIATHHNSGGAVIPDYYQKAVNWDRTQSQLRNAAEPRGAR